MATFQKVTKMATVPIGAAALTSASSLFLGRQTVSKSTNQVSNAASRQLHSAIKDRCLKVNYQHLQRQQQQQQHKLYNSTNNATTTMMRRVAGKRNFSTAPAAKPTNKSFMEWYEGHLESRPVLTKMITGSALWGLGDLVAQIVPVVFFDDGVASAAAPSDGKDAKKGSASATKEFEYDYARTGRAMIFGFGLHAPLSHAHFNFLEWMTVKGGFTGLSIPVFKAFMEQFVYWSWVSNALYHGAMGTMQGKTPQQVYDRLCDVLWDTQKAQWAFWIPVQLLNFQFVPVRHQLNVVLMTSVVWTALLSAWYPPENDGDDADKDASEEKERR